MTIAEPVNSFVDGAFRSEVEHEGDEIRDIAYTMTVQKTGIAATLPATVTMSAPGTWVTAHGGPTAIVIGRIADDQTCTILKTSFTGYDRDGNMVFVADSPGGLSVFGFIATQGPLQAKTGQPGFMTLVQQNPVLSVIIGVITSIPGAFDGRGVLVLVTILVILIIVVITGCIIWRERRRVKSPDQQHKK
jgi:hypothetical protein